MEEELSLGTFEPSHAQAPYLNTPRSLEACRIHGVNPIELVSIPYEEFRKGFPNDDDAARRRFERIDGARKRIFTAVLATWDEICSNKKDTANSFDNLKETIIEVPREARSTLLQIQAERFRKIESDNWNSIQRKINLSIQSAYREEENKKIIEAQNKIEKANNDTKKMRSLQREELYRQQLEALARKEEQNRIEIKRAQQIEAEEALKLERMHHEEKVNAKLRREKLEQDRRRREDYTKNLKNSIYKEMEKTVSQKEKLLKQKDEEFKERSAAQRELKKRENFIKRQQIEQRSNTAKAKMEKEAEDKAAAIKKQLDDDEKRVLKQLAESKPQSKDAELKMKVENARRQSEKVENDKIQKTKAELEIKEALARQELEKTKLEQERRRNIKLIRQEAFELASSRRKKANEYKEAKLMASLKMKDDKYQAIKGGYKKLEDMRRVMHEIISKTTLAITDEVKNLHHKDQLSPNTLTKSAMEISKKVLFPNLSSKFTIDKESSKKNKQPEYNDYNLDDSNPEAALRSSTGGMASWDQFLTASESLGLESENNNDNNKTLQRSNRAFTAPTISPKPLTANKSHGAQTGSSFEAAKSKLSLKFISPSNFEEAINTSKTRYEKSASPTERVSSAKGKRPGSKSTKNDIELLRALSKRVDPLHQDTEFSPDTADNLDNKQSLDNLSSDLNTSNKLKLKPLEGKTNLVSPKSTFLPVSEEEFRREHSADHPLAMGKGKYTKELKAGKMPAGAAKIQSKKLNESLVIFENKVSNLDDNDTKRELEILRRKQNEILLRVLEEERKAEERRMSALRDTTDNETRANLELIFAEERKRASERIIQQTKENEAIIKHAMISSVMN